MKTYNGVQTVWSICGVGEMGQTCAKKMKLFIPQTRINSKWIKDLNVTLEAIKILEEITGSKISDISYSNIISDISPQAKEIKEKINK